jgi:hypothetical protein
MNAARAQPRRRRIRCRRQQIRASRPERGRRSRPTKPQRRPARSRLARRSACDECRDHQRCPPLPARAGRSGRGHGCGRPRLRPGRAHVCGGARPGCNDRRSETRRAARRQPRLHRDSPQLRRQPGQGRTRSAAGRALLSVANTGPLCGGRRAPAPLPTLHRLDAHPSSFADEAASASRSSRQSPTRATLASAAELDPSAVSESTWLSPPSTERSRIRCAAPAQPS